MKTKGKCVAILTVCLATVVLALAAHFLKIGYGTAFTIEYYFFSGKVIDRETGAGVPRAAICVAVSPDDFEKPPLIYHNEVSPRNADISSQFFKRKKANRYLFLMADDEGNFSTVWRQDWVVTAPLFFGLFPSRLPSISFLAGAPGYSDGAATFKATAEGNAFSGNRCPSRVRENRLPTIAIGKGHSAAKALSAIKQELLRTIDRRSRRRTVIVLYREC